MGDYELSELRKEIDKTDEELMRLIKKRLETADKIAECKRKTGMAVLDIQREQEVMEKIKAIARKEGIDEEAATGIFKEIIAKTREHETKR